MTISLGHEPLPALPKPVLAAYRARVELVRQNYLQSMRCRLSTHARCCSLPPLSSAATGSLEKRLQNIKIFVSGPFGAGVLSVAEHSVTCGRAGELGWAGLSPWSLAYFPGRKALRCWPSWSTASPNGVLPCEQQRERMWGCMENTSFYHNRPFPRCSACSGTAKPQLSVWGVCLFQASVSVFMSRALLSQKTVQHHNSCKVWCS